jgi:23S rRNA (cytosine1962-C5)-methyltransferase
MIILCLFCFMQLLSPKHFDDYELIDCGDFEKLERFGKYVLIRPEPQAVWPKIYSNQDWEKHAHIKFIPKSSSSGEWKKIKQMPDQWEIKYKVTAMNDENKINSTNSEKFNAKAFNQNIKDKSEGVDLVFRLGLTSFKHVGIFPEQAVNWNKIYGFIIKQPQAKFLNLFAYTGGASIAAKAAGADVTHVDSIKQVVSWANENMQKSNLDNIRWLVDDALKFVKKEMRRGNLYQGIILDPPAFGHGPNGEKWKLEDNIQEMMQSVLQILDPQKHLLILNAYSLGFSALIPENLLSPFAKKNKSQLSVGELYLQAKSGVKLPLGVWGNLLKE